MSDEETAGQALKRSLRLLTWATVSIYLVLAALGVLGWIAAANQRQELQRIAVTTQDALCTFRADLERRVADTREFLMENPKGIPGISDETLQRSIDNQQQTIDALDQLECE